MIFRTVVLSVLIVTAGCTGNIIFPGKSFKKRVQRDFSERESIPEKHRNDLQVFFRENSDRRLNEALMFLYAYMPLSDLADYNAGFFIENTIASFRARDEMNRTATVPPLIFLHYVLPVRVNDENLDRFRPMFYEELRDRIAELDVREAVLEINRWCHEKATYQPSDFRTSSPLKTMQSARGRCGEESTFAVAALRAVGIPARQVYTPRWAHADDNHAWVEVWIDGEWFYLGACEPEPVLDRGWFTEPARRAMLVHTKAFGAYAGSEKLIRNERLFAEINNLGKYAPTKNITVKVTDRNGYAVEDSWVEFCLYNYAEFYPIASVRTDKEGLCSFETGLGYLLVRTGEDTSFGFEIMSVSETDTLYLVTDMEPGLNACFNADLSIPPEPEPFKPVDAALAAKNQILIRRGDSIRNSYTGTWPGKEDALRFAAETGYPDNGVTELILKSHGNYCEIMSFLEKNSDRKELALEILRQISEKDLRDVEENVLSGHLRHASRFLGRFDVDDHSLFNDYVLNPRIENELLVNWRESLEGMGNSFSEILNAISIYEGENYYEVPITPAGVAENKIADTRSLAIFLVAWYRSHGIPARLEPVTGIPQYYDANWNDILLPGAQYKPGDRSYVTFRYEGPQPEPEYFHHFTIARYDDGYHRTLDFDYYKKISEIGDSIAVLPGHYLLVTGNRLENGKILTNLKFFSIEAGEHITLDIKPRKKPD